MHTIRDCIASQEAWSHYIPPRLMNSFFSSPLKEWVNENLGCKRRRDEVVGGRIDS